MIEFQPELERLAKQMGLLFPSVNYVKSTPEQLHELAAMRGIPNRYIYPWVSDSLLREPTVTPLEVVVCDRPSAAFVDTWAMADSATARRVIAHVCGHADLFYSHPAFQRLQGFTLGRIGRSRLQIVEKRVGQNVLWTFLERLHTGEIRESEVVETWQIIAADAYRNEQSYLKPFEECQLLSEGWATFWEQGLCSLRQPPTGEPYRVGLALIHELRKAGKLWHVYEYDDKKLLREFWTRAFCDEHGYPYLELDKFFGDWAQLKSALF